MNIILAKGSNPVLLNFQSLLQIRYFEYQGVPHNNSLEATWYAPQFAIDGADLLSWKA